MLIFDQFLPKLPAWWMVVWVKQFGPHWNILTATGTDVHGHQRIHWIWNFVNPTIFHVVTPICSFLWTWELYHACNRQTLAICPCNSICWAAKLASSDCGDCMSDPYIHICQTINGCTETEANLLSRVFPHNSPQHKTRYSFSIQIR